MQSKWAVINVQLSSSSLRVLLGIFEVKLFVECKTGTHLFKKPTQNLAITNYKHVFLVSELCLTTFIHFLHQGNYSSLPDWFKINLECIRRSTTMSYVSQKRKWPFIMKIFADSKWKDLWKKVSSICYLRECHCLATEVTHPLFSLQSLSDLVLYLKGI